MVVAPLLLVLLVSCVTGIAVSWLTASSRFYRATVLVGPVTAVLASRKAARCGPPRRGCSVWLS